MLKAKLDSKDFSLDWVWTLFKKNGFVVVFTGFGYRSLKMKELVISGCVWSGKFTVYKNMLILTP